MASPNQGHSGWFALLDDVPAAQPLVGTRACEWLIIGAGCCGLAAAHRLGELRPDDDVIVLDSEQVGAGSSGRNSGFMINAHLHGIETDHSQLKNQFMLWDAGVAWLRDTVERCQIQCDWSEWGRLYVAVGAAGRAHLDQLSERFTGLGYATTTLDASAMREATASDFYSAGVHMGGSALVQPAALMRGLARHLPTNIALFEDSPVNRLSRSGGQWHAVTPEGTVSARKVIITAGAGTPALGFMRHRIAPLMLYASLTRPLMAAEREQFASVSEFGLLPTSANGSTVRLTRDHRILMRNITRYAGRALADGLDVARTSHQRAIAARWPTLAGVELEHTWGGVMGVTRNGGSLFGAVGDEAYAVMTTDVSPVARGTVAGRLLIDHILDEPGPLLDVQRALSAAKRVPPEPFLGWIANHRLARLEAAEAEET